ncbi:hypothetical protein R8Z57_05375 [Microbacterium sp. M3]|uniref:Uncharacterized protein n=1 Tax=Microbacterium arthrosphaerae TaxID=792652 RepID=A0ABU4GYQ8_9MICO|nr:MULTISPECIES: hypothetical protein [Microbacterium]MDW4572208.1 hypothetical protein [Microbacterium arthrosphaerae]MDW7606063.1 hypothetical protein [Microbacterium sp. M3]
MDDGTIALWGLLADWFAAVGTVGALVLTIVIVLRDRRHSARELADQLVSNLDVQARIDDSGGFRLRLFVANYSSVAMRSIALVGPDMEARDDEPEEWSDAMFVYGVVPAEEEMQAEWMGGDSTYVGLPPGDSKRLELVSQSRPPSSEYFLLIRDGRGRVWLRNAHTGQYVRNRRARRMVQHAFENDHR